MILEVSHCLRSVRIHDVSVVCMLSSSSDYLTENFISYFKIGNCGWFRTRDFFLDTVMTLTTVLKMAVESNSEVSSASNVYPKTKTNR
jgi:hypothetical protein